MKLRKKCAEILCALLTQRKRWQRVPLLLLLMTFLLSGAVYATIVDSVNILNTLAGQSHRASGRSMVSAEAGAAWPSEAQAAQTGQERQEAFSLLDVLSGFLNEDPADTKSDADQEEPQASGAHGSKTEDQSDTDDSEDPAQNAEKTMDADVKNPADEDEIEEPDSQSGQTAPSFRDVDDPSIYYYRPVYWAVSRNLTNGVSERFFGPEQTCTRAQIVTFLWRAAGEPETASLVNPFEDVGDSDYFRDAVFWAVERGITQGTDEGIFEPDGLCTRAQCVTFLWRFFEASDDGARSDFKDVPDDAYYGASVFWALKYGVTNGTALKAFSPDATCTRGQTVTFFYRSMMEKAVRDEMPEQERPTGGIRPVEFDGTTGDFEIRTIDIDESPTLEEVRVSVWTKEDQSDIRWFSLSTGTDRAGKDYGITLNVKTFHRFFGKYHAGLYLVASSGESVRQIHMENCSFQLIPHNYMYAEDQGKGFVRVHVLGVPEEITALQIIGYGETTDPENYDVADAEQAGDGSWVATVDWLSFMDDGNCYLEERPVGWESGVNTIAIRVHPFKQVIDVSQHQGKINWQTAKNSGRFEAAILRCGLRSSKGKCTTDTMFYRNANACRDWDIPMGVYWFTSALTVAEAEEEADYCASLIRSFPLSYPVFLDTEWGNRKGLNSLNKETRTACIQAFLNRMKSYGFETGIYASQEWIRNYLDYSAIADETIWYASWNGRAKSFTDYAAWQYETKAQIPGIPENTVDLSHWFE